MRRAQPEAVIQRAIFAHYGARAERGVFAFAVPNGGFRRYPEAAILKATGTTPGVPDTIWIREGQAFGLEIKTAVGKLSERQCDVIEEMEGAGAICHVAYGLDDAITWLEQNRLLKGRAA